MDKFEFDVFLLRDAMLALHMPSLCVHLCGVDVAYYYRFSQPRDHL